MSEVIVRIDGLVAQERFERAGALIDEQLQRDDLAPDVRWALRLRQAERWLAALDRPPDEAIFLAEDLLGERQTDEAARGHAVLVRAYTIKRCPDLALEALEAAEAAVGPAVEILVSRGSRALEFDEREEAKAAYDEALRRYPESPLAHMAVANLCYVLGEFDGCHAHLEGITRPDAPRVAGWGRALRLRASAFAATEDYQSEAEQWRRLATELPGGDYAQDDRIAFALALASLGRREEALQELRTAWRASPETQGGRYARERIEHLERAADAAPRRRLAAFPTTQQKWNYCGPAVLELCLRHLNIDLGQDEIAAQVKRTSGTPMYEMAQYLRERGVVARRIEATPDRLRRAIDIGLPVIVQEEYSTTSHVAVITGYDEALGLFIASDPMTHRQVLRSFNWTERAGSMYGNGGLIVLGREGGDLAPLLRRADDADLVEARHLVVLDECDRRRAHPSSGELEDVTLEHVIKLAEEAIALSPRFRLAHYRLWHAENQLYQISGREHLRERVLQRLHHIRTGFVDDEWPHQLHAQWLMDNGRYEEAFVAYHEASRRDPLDANNLQAMGECKWLAGDLRQAERYMLEALAAEPFHLRAAENLAGVYLRQLEELDRRRTGTEDGLDRLTAMAPSRISAELEAEEQRLVRRGRHFNRIARSLFPENPYNHEVAGALLFRDGDHEAAAAAFARAREIAPDRLGALYGLARALSRAGHDEDALALLAEGTERFWREPLAWRAHAAALGRCGREDEAVAVLERGFATLSEGHSELVRPYFDAVKGSSTSEAAGARLRQLAERRGADDELLRDVAFLLDEEGQRGHAVALLRHVVAASPSDVNVLYRLAHLLAEDLLSRDEGRALLERVVELAPDAPAPRRQLAWLLLDEDPVRGLELLEPVLGHEDPYVHETQSALLAQLGREQEAGAAFELALEAQGAIGPGLIDLCAWHLSSNRYQRALVVARQIFDHPLPDDEVEDAWVYWLQAHRLAGAVREAMPRLAERCADGVPPELAWDVYWACRSFDHTLAARAAEAHAGQLGEGRERLEWEILAAGQRAKLGDDGPLERVRERVGQDARLWAHLAWAYADLKRFDRAREAALQARALDPDDRDVLTVMEETHVRLDQPEEALACARRLAELHPFEHQGPERLGILLAKLFETEEALGQSLRAVDAAPFCHIAQRSRALALFVAGRFDEAERHARQSLALDEPDEEDPANEALMVLRALEGDAAGLQRCLDTLGREEPPRVFARFKAHLVEVARQRAGS